MKQKHPKRCKNCDCGIPDERLGGLFPLKLKENKSTIMAKISYSGVVLTPESRTQLLNKLGHRIPEGWETVAHHMTITMGELPPELKEMIGLPVKLKVISCHADDKVAAIQVIPPADLAPFVKNSLPHITLAVNRAGGGKPVMSNKMLAAVNHDVPDTISPFEITGLIEEVPQSV